ncbi:Regulation of nuclear pre-mRNA domain-containing protein 1B [Rhynchospora pubera]|uniref:Regulation of nuclear pre-mRNA domain-containing protein 1B n=1 Tax=Rhynchospora pubera TaxID=906938 RepID=A0AAV8GWX6_9POAL|nr:Regulation of nuclear pre-mRNA domain-containing protein 1B [Rhynchospora pubera]
MNGSFNSQIFIEKLSKLNGSQQSIETLSHWCIFHRNKAKQVVDTWEQQFHCAPREQRIAFLYLANDILQNSRRKGVEFIAEFWRVLPGALADVLRKGGESGRSSVLRLLNIWNERKVFGSRGQALKEELFGKNSENQNEDSKETIYKLKQPSKEMIDKLTSSYEHIFNLPLDEDTLYEKCQTAVNFVDKIEKDYGNKSILGENNNPELARDLEAQQRILRECIENLKASKLSRNNLITRLKEAIDEQEIKIQQVSSQLQVAQSRFDQANKILGHAAVPTSGGPTLTSIPNVESPTNLQDQTLATTTGSADDRKSAAAAVAARLAASTCSAQMLSLVFSSLASSENQNQSAPDAKRPKLDPAASTLASYVPQPVAPPLPQSQPEPAPPIPFPHSPPKEEGNSSVPSVTVPLQSVMMPMPGGVIPFAYGSVGPSPPFPLPDYTVLAQGPYIGGPGPYQGLHGPAEGGLLGAPPAPFTPTPPPLNRP